MQLSPDLWLQGPYYIDFDVHNQLRIVGPHNHLHFGSVGLTRRDFDITEVNSNTKGQLIIRGQFKTSELELHDPAMGHIRKVRNYIEIPGQQGKAAPTFAAVMKRHPAALSPTYIGLTTADRHSELIYRRYYGNHWYGVTLQFEKGIHLERVESRRRVHIKGNGPIAFSIMAETDEPVRPGVKTVIAEPVPPTLADPLNRPEVIGLLVRTAAETTHLVQYNKTAGFGYGTVFPRDWMESADLGAGGDLTPTAALYMYHKSLQHTDENGQGWHEDIVGEFAHEKTDEVQLVRDDLDALIDRSSQLSHELKSVITRIQQLYINRNMIDIEPRYLLALRRFNFNQFNSDDQEHLKRVAAYVLEQAEQHELMTFKKIPSMLRRTADEEFSSAGNWRDSDMAFKMVHPIIAPYDVNVVFYPQALKVMAEHARVLGLNKSEVEAAAAKWGNVRDLYRFTNKDGNPGFALALYDVAQTESGITFRRLEVNHTDEAYELFYGQPAEADVINFCNRLLNPDYFHTRSGPLVVGSHDGYDTTQYHGKVIWTKQTAWVVAGLDAQLVLHAKDWPEATLELIRQALLETSRSSIEAFQDLGAIPELHYDNAGRPGHYSLQPVTEGPSNTVQLWSAIGARRIIRAYNEVSAWPKSI